MAPTKRRYEAQDHKEDKLCPSKAERNSHWFQFLDFPLFIQEMIFGYLPFGTVSKIRLVCRQFNLICSSLLNKEFRNLRVIVQQKFLSIKQKMPRRESARRKHPLARESDIVETLHMRLTLLQMTFGKHIERSFCCFFPGEILGEVHKILIYVKTTPNLSQAYKVTDELFDLTTMAMEYFKEHIETTLPEITSFSSDLLDCMPNSSRSHLSLNRNKLFSDESSTSSSDTSVVDYPAMRKQLMKLHSNTKRNNRQALLLKKRLRTAQQHMTKQQKQMIDLKIRLERYDTKLQDMSHKLNTVVQELGYCKTELQFWRSKSPAVQCICGKATPVKELKDDALDNHQIEDKQEFKPISTHVDEHSFACSCSRGPFSLETSAMDVPESNSAHLPLIEDEVKTSCLESRCSQMTWKATKMTSDWQMELDEY